MPCIRLHDRLMGSEGILQRLQEIQSALQKIPASLVEDVRQKKMSSLRGDLQSIFFQGVAEQQILPQLRLALSVFVPDYILLQQALLMVFSDQSLDDMIHGIASLNCSDWTPEAVVLERHYHRLHTAYHYFESEGCRDLFQKLVIVCRKVCVLIEQNNTPDDTMAYDYAYTLMGILVDERQPLPSFEAMSQRIEVLLRPSDKALKVDAKPFHDHLLDFKLPDSRHDRRGWLALIHKVGSKALPFFRQADRIEEKNAGQAPHTLKEARDIAALLTYQRALEDRAWTQLCHRYEVPESIFNAGLDYIGSPAIWPKKESDLIPDITIHQDIYVWTKLSSRDKRGLILGKITDCCQSIGGHSSQCVKDAMSLSENALYVLLKQKKSTTQSFKTSDGLMNDDDYQIIGQSYVWKSKSGNLCLDSIECLRDSISPEILKQILKDFAQQVLAQTTSVKRVMLGTGGKTPKGLFETTSVIPESISQGLFYGDAITQYLITQRPHRLTLEQQQALSCYESSFKDCMLYLSDYLVDTTDFTECLSELVSKNSKLVSKFSVGALYQLLRFTPIPCMNDLELINFDALPSATIYSTGHLIWQANTPQKMIQVLPYLCPEDFLTAVKEKSENGVNVLHYAANHPDLFKILLSMYPESERLTAVMIKDRHNRTVFDCVAKYPDLLKVMLLLLPESERLVALKERGRSYPILHDAATDPELLKIILLLYPESERQTIIRQRGEYRNTLFHRVAEHFESLTVILSFFPESERLSVMKEKNSLDDTVLHHAAKHPKSLELLLSLYPESERLSAVKEKNKNGDTVLHDAAKHHSSLELLLSLYPESERLSSVKEKNKRGNTVLHDAAKHPKSLELLLSLYPESERLSAVKEKNKNSDTVLHSAAEHPKSLELLLSLYPESERLSAVKEKNKNGDTVLYSVGYNPDSLQLILSLYPESERLSAVKEKSMFTGSLLYRAETAFELLRVMLSLLPENDRLALLKEKNIRGASLFYYVVNHSNSFQVVQLLLPESQLLIMLKERDQRGRTVLHYVADNPRLLKMIFPLYPEFERLTALKEINKLGHTVLDDVVDNLESLTAVLSALPLSHLILVGDEIPCLNFELLKKVVVTKLNQLHYSDNDMQLIQDTFSMDLLKERLAIIVQHKFKSRLPREQAYDAMSEDLSHRLSV